jgi:hypothetical protein
MGIELDRDKERVLIRTALRREMAIIKGSEGHLDEALSNMIVEALFETAAVTRKHGPEDGIRAGRVMIQKWSD